MKADFPFHWKPPRTPGIHFFIPAQHSGNVACISTKVVLSHLFQNGIKLLIIFERKTIMGRPQEFDNDAVVESVLSVFWSQGLHRTSVDDLLAASGLARSSLYNSFGGKQALFEQAVHRYVDHQVTRLQMVLDTPSLQAALENLFHIAITDNYEGKGCLLVNCASNLMRDDALEQRLLRGGFERMLAIMETRIRKAQDLGELSDSIDPASAAVLVCTTLSGLRVFQKTGMQKAKLKKAADLAVKVLLQQMD